MAPRRARRALNSAGRRTALVGPHGNGLQIGLGGGIPLAEALRRRGWPAARRREGAMDRFERRRMDGAEFHDVSLAGARFDNVNLSGARLENVNLSGVSIVNANIKGLRIFGYDVAGWIQEQLDRDCGEHH
jgi:uncharacterized protein YjbI with pentapeptide repeats